MIYLKRIAIKQTPLHAQGVIAIADIPPKSIAFLKKYINSVWQLELILLLRASSSPLSLADIGRSMYMPTETIEPVLNNFVKQGIVQVADEPTKRYLFLPQTIELREAIEEVVRAYSQKRTAVISLIFSSPMEYFSDAFKLTSKEE